MTTESKDNRQHKATTEDNYRKEQTQSKTSLTSNSSSSLSKPILNFLKKFPTLYDSKSRVGGAIIETFH